MGIYLDNAFEYMINVLCQAGQIEEAYKLADRIIWVWLRNSRQSLCFLINVTRKTGNVDLALELMSSKIGNGYDRMGSIKKGVKFPVLVDK